MKKFFHKIIAFLSSIFTNLNEWIYDHVQPSIETVQTIKAFLDSPVADLITNLIPTTIDDKLREWLQKNLSKAIDVLAVTADIQNQPTLELKLAALLEYIKTLSPSLRKGVYMRLASEMAISSGGKENVKGRSVDLLTQLQFTKMAEKISAEDLPYTDHKGNVIDKPVEYKQTFFNPGTMRHE